MHKANSIKTLFPTEEYRAETPPVPLKAIYRAANTPEWPVRATAPIKADSFKTAPQRKSKLSPQL